MNYLLDTHIVLWALADEGRLDEEIRTLLINPDNTIYYSMASVWEVAVKHKIHPEQMPISEEEFVSLCEKTGFEELSIENSHIYAVKTLSRLDTAPKHNDPFDRLLIAQAKSEELKFITHDGLLEAYNESCIMKI